MKDCGSDDRLRLGPWTADRMTGRLEGPGATRPVEPKVMDLLFLLAAEPGKVVGREALHSALWPGVTVGDDSLARCVFKLRTALRDGPDRSFAVETIPKRGYRLVETAAGRGEAAGRPRPLRWRVRAVAAAVLLAAAGLGASLSAPGRADGRQQTIERARDAYFQYSLEENEAAAELFERVLAENPHDAQALAGLSSVVVQRLLRWPGGRELKVTGSRLQAALRSGRLGGRSEKAQLGWALVLAQRAVSSDPGDPEVQRSYGLALAALNRRAEAAAAYDRAMAADPRAWGAMINRADLFDLEGRPEAAVEVLERAYDSMDGAYRDQPARVRPWLAAVGTDVARRHLALGDRGSALRWYRRTLHDNPQAAEARRALRDLTPRGRAGLEAAPSSGT